MRIEEDVEEGRRRRGRRNGAGFGAVLDGENRAAETLKKLFDI